jgi:hypothetical protein
MNLVVLNFSGNVGKTAISRHLLAPRLGGGAPVISVESVNTDGQENRTLRGKAFGKLMEELSVVDNAVIDVGASNAEEFLNMMREFEGAHEDIDHFIVPTVPRQKQMGDTMKTLMALAEMGVPAKKVNIVFNMMDRGDMVDDAFAPIFEYWRRGKCFVLRKNAVIRSNELFGLLVATPGQDIASLLADTTDYKTLIKDTSDPDEKVRLTRLLGLRRLATSTSAALDEVFDALFNQPKKVG